MIPQENASGQESIGIFVVEKPEEVTADQNGNELENASGAESVTVGMTEPTTPTDEAMTLAATNQTTVNEPIVDTTPNIPNIITVDLVPQDTSYLTQMPIPSVVISSSVPLMEDMPEPKPAP